MLSFFNFGPKYDIELNLDDAEARPTFEAKVCFFFFFLRFEIVARVCVVVFVMPGRHGAGWFTVKMDGDGKACKWLRLELPLISMVLEPDP